MRFTVTSSLLLSAVASAGTIPRDIPSTFQIYGYGEGIGGLSIFSAGGETFIGDYKLADNEEAAPVIFTPTDNAWLASPNTTETDRPTWDKYKFAVPATSSSSHDVTLVDQDNEDVVTDSFTSYGTVVLVSGNNGNVESHWYAVPSDTEGVYSLKWNDNAAGSILVTLKATPPSS